MADGGIAERMGRALQLDGLTEMFAALLFGSLAAAWEVGGIVLAVIGVAAIVGLKGLEWVRARVVHPRTGYAVRASDDARSLGSGMAITTVSVIGGGLFVAWYVGDVGLVRTWVAALAGALVAAGVWHLAGRSRMVRHHLLAMATILWGFTVTVTWGDAGYASLVPFFIGLSVTFGLVGVWAFVEFLRSHPKRSA